MNKFKLGDRVTIKDSSRYRYQQPFINGEKIVGTIIEIRGVNKSGMMDTEVRFDNGYSNSYDFEDLELFIEEIEDDEEFENDPDVYENKKFKNFGDFIMEKYKIIISDEPKSDFGTDEWLLTIDISDLWKKFDNNKINLVYFINQYKDLLNFKKEQIISKTNEQSFAELQELLNKLDTSDKEGVYSTLDDIYDWADKYGIKIKTK